MFFRLTLNLRSARPTFCKGIYCHAIRLASLPSACPGAPAPSAPRNTPRRTRPNRRVPAACGARASGPRLRRGVGGIELDGGPGGFGLRGLRVQCCVVRGEEGFESLTQGRVAVARYVEEHGALVRWFFQRQHKQNFFAVWIHEQFMVGRSFVTPRPAPAGAGCLWF